MPANQRDGPPMAETALFGDQETETASGVPLPSLRVLQAAGAIRSEKAPKYHGGFRRMWPAEDVLKAALAAALGEHFAWSIRLVAAAMAKVQPALWNILIEVALTQTESGDPKNPKPTFLVASELDWRVELIDRKFLFFQIPELFTDALPGAAAGQTSLLLGMVTKDTFVGISWELATPRGRKLAKEALGDEEICAVDPGFATILLVNGLGLMPVAWYGTEEQKKKWIGAATNDPNHEYLAGWVVSEPAGTPGGTANFDHPGAHPVGIGVTATHDRGRGEYVINGKKYWPCNAGGWDLKGANVNVVIVRVESSKGGKQGLAGALVPREAGGVRYEQPIDKIGHRLCQNNAMTFEDCRIPEENMFAIGDGDLIISKAFTWSGPVAAIAAVGVARSAYEYTLEWAKIYTAGGDKPIIMHQAVGYMLTDIAMRIEACRSFSWKAAHYLDQYNSEGHAIGAMSKIFCGELLFDTVFKCMQVMGVNAVDKRHPLERYLREAVIFPLYDAGNIGMQRRKIWGVMADPAFDPRAIADNRPIEFKKSMEGIGTAIGAE